MFIIIIIANIIHQRCQSDSSLFSDTLRNYLVTLIILNKKQDNLFHSDQHVLLWLQNSHVLVDCACLMVVIL